MNTKGLHLLLVTLQFGGIFYFFISGVSFPKNWIVAIIELDAILLGLWAMISMNSKTISVLPDAREEASLTQKGPYKLIRHPMYTAVLELLLALLVNDFSWIRFVVLCLVLTVLLYKISIEEKILSSKYPDYPEYIKTTKKLIPFIF
jgi:protein-S-isoprenylcysteine O-methyltransferase Ste14